MEKSATYELKVQAISQYLSVNNLAQCIESTMERGNVQSDNKKSDIVVHTAACIQQPVYLRNGLIRHKRFLSSTLLL